MPAGRNVTKLEYQAYSKVAIKTMSTIVNNAIGSAARSSSPRDSASRRPIHRDRSVVAHRKEAFVACEEILEEVKKKAQIWKREYYEGEDENEAEWKANT
ncbi:hypothetical protein NLJ89_g1163 [Agrocybe chaxingu]|uniref:Uncharacterized protein n=1 Tax=Agrocybe chaxingu TaxID=84603 RepID=A0A9W8N0I5_9AGAR|nr:hypothetical protein NLJ89_g1163 [Agrocybe chaxingu]